MSIHDTLFPAGQPVWVRAHVFLDAQSYISVRGGDALEGVARLALDPLKDEDEQLQQTQRQQSPDDRPCPRKTSLFAGARDWDREQCTAAVSSGGGSDHPALSEGDWSKFDGSKSASAPIGQAVSAEVVRATDGVAAASAEADINVGAITGGNDSDAYAADAADAAAGSATARVDAAPLVQAALEWLSERPYAVLGVRGDIDDRPEHSADRGERRDCDSPGGERGRSVVDTTGDVAVFGGDGNDGSSSIGADDEDGEDEMKRQEERDDEIHRACVGVGVANVVLRHVCLLPLLVSGLQSNTVVVWMGASADPGDPALPRRAP